MKKLNKVQKIRMLCAFCAMAGVSAFAEGAVSASSIITQMQTDVILVLGLILTLVGAVIAAASGIWLAVLAYKRSRGATKSVA